MDITALATPANLGIGSVIAGIIGIVLWFLKRNSSQEKKPRHKIKKAKRENRNAEILKSLATVEESRELVKIEKRLKQINTELGS